MNAPERIAVPDRSKFIGGSDVAAILGVSPWVTPFMLFQKKTGAYVEDITPAKQRILDRGHRWEPIVLEMLVDELRDRGHDVEVLATGQRYQDAELPFLACELDAELLIDGEETNAEMKTASYFASGAWGDRDSNDVPIYYAAQVMHGLMVKPRRRAVVAAVTGFDESPMVRWLDRDDETISAIRAREVEFWQRIQDGTPPDPVTPEDVKWLYPKDSGVSIEADDELISACATLKLLKRDAKIIDGDIEILATKIKARMGSAAVLLGADGKPLATWKANKDGTKTDWKAAFQEVCEIANVGELCGQLIETHTKTTEGARPFLVK